MDDSFDKLVPDNWLELPSKRKLEEPADASTQCCKKSKFSAPSNNASVACSSRISHDSENSNGTYEDTSVNEPDFAHFENSYVPLQFNNKSVVVNGNDYHSTPDELDSRINQTNYASHAGNKRINNGNNNSELQMTECLTSNQDSTINSWHSNVENQDVLVTEHKNVLRNGELGCLEPESSSFKPGCSGEPSSSEKVSRLNNVSSLVTDAKVISDIFPFQEFNTIYKLLLEHRDESDRVGIAIFQLTNSESGTSTADDLPVPDIFEEVQLVSQAVPSADVNEIYTLLEQLPPSSSRVLDVITKLKPPVNSFHRVESSAYPDVSLLETSIASVSEDSLLEDDPLFKDMRTIASLFPEKDRNEIYALLEAKVNQANRIESVINEILYGQAAGPDGTQQSQPAAAANTVNDSTSAIVIEDAIQHDMERMRAIFPDCDPNYLYEKLDNLKTNSDRTTVLAAEMFEKRDYPKLKDLLDKEHEKEKTRRARHLKMSEAEFLQKFPDPIKTFSDCTKEPSKIYKEHSDILLKNQFPMLTFSYLAKVLQKHNGHLYPAYQEISALVVTTSLDQRRKMPMFLRRKKHGKLPMPDTADEYFYHELWFVYNELSVLDYIKQAELLRQMKIEQARTTGELHECGCCFDDECLLEDLVSCPEGHLFCKTCVIRSTEAAFGDMKTKFPCLSGYCDKGMPLSYLQTIIPAGLFSKIVHRLQEEEVQQANIPDLVTCPFCPFAAIMPDPNDKVFKCLNPECLKESCRFCRELNHIPLRCNEVEKKAETDMRVYIENKISEAVMRKCHKCGKRFVKDDGCNKMTCICGATSCYACKATDIDYQHFDNNRKCANTDPNIIHQRDMEEAAIVAKSQYLLDHPEAADIDLKTDVRDMIQDFKQSTSRNPRHLYYDNQDYTDDEEEDDEYMHDDDDTDEYDSANEDVDETDGDLSQYRNNQDYGDADDYNSVDENPDDDDDSSSNISLVDSVNSDLNDKDDDDSDDHNSNWIDVDHDDYISNVESVDDVNGDVSDVDDDDYISRDESVNNVNSDLSDVADDDYISRYEFVIDVNGDPSDVDDDDYNSNAEFVDDIDDDWTYVD